MSDLVALFKAWLPTMTAEDRADVLKVIDEQIEMTIGNAQDTAKHLAGATAKFHDAWTRMIEKRRQDIDELKEVKRLLSAQIERD